MLRRPSNMDLNLTVCLTDLKLVGHHVPEPLVVHNPHIDFAGHLSTVHPTVHDLRTMIAETLQGQLFSKVVHDFLLALPTSSIHQFAVLGLPQVGARFFARGAEGSGIHELASEGTTLYPIRMQYNTQCK